MIKALTLEWLKLKNYSVFKTLLLTYIFSIIIVSFFSKLLLNQITLFVPKIYNLVPSDLPIYDFPDIWQNSTYIISYLKIFPCVIVIISTTNEYIFSTLRQNIIDGVSKLELIISKMYLTIFLALLGVITVVICNLINGFFYSPVKELDFILDEIEFLLVLLIDTITYSSLGLLLAIKIKNPRFIIIPLFFYTYFFEPTIVFVLQNTNTFRGSIYSKLSHFLPVNAINSLIPFPFSKYFFIEIVDYVPFDALLIVFAWLIVFLSLSYYWLLKIDFK